MTGPVNTDLLAYKEALFSYEDESSGYYPVDDDVGRTPTNVELF
jgi:hypothetical protein